MVSEYSPGSQLSGRASDCPKTGSSSSTDHRNLSKPVPMASPHQDTVEEKAVKWSSWVEGLKIHLLQWSESTLKLLSHPLLHSSLLCLPAWLLVKCTGVNASFFLSASVTQPTFPCSLPSYYFTPLNKVPHTPPSSVIFSLPLFPFLFTSLRGFGWLADQKFR